jgi:hypothetical protein
MPPRARAGAGRPHRQQVKRAPQPAQSARARIIQRLDDFIHGHVELTSAQVTAALGLLKILPDLSEATAVHLTDEQLYSRIRELAERIGVELRGAPGAVDAPGRSEPSR